MEPEQTEILREIAKRQKIEHDAKNAGGAVFLIVMILIIVFVVVLIS